MPTIMEISPIIPSGHSHYARQPCRLKRLLVGEADIIHAHDWMASAVSAYLNADQSRKSSSPRTRSVLTIHNLQHQGVFSHKDFQSSGLPTAYWGMDGFEHNGALNLLKGGIQHADKITTVSPTYALEIRTLNMGVGWNQAYNTAVLI